MVILLRANILTRKIIIWKICKFVLSYLDCTNSLEGPIKFLHYSTSLDEQFQICKIGEFIFSFQNSIMPPEANCFQII